MTLSLNAKALYAWNVKQGQLSYTLFSTSRLLDFSTVNYCILNKKGHVRLRLLLLIALPSAISSTASVFFFFWLTADSLSRQNDSYGKLVAAQLAVSSADYLLKNDLLSLNVVLTELLEKHRFAQLSVYSADNRILAQAGVPVRSKNLRVFTAEISYQDSIAGFVRISLDNSGLISEVGVYAQNLALANLILVLFLVLIVWLFHAQIVGWFVIEQETEVAELVPDTLSILVIKLRPAAIMLEFRDVLFKVIRLYNGEITHTEDEEIAACFHHSSHCLEGICASLLIGAILADRPAIDFKAGYHFGQADEIEAIRKHASHLASLADNCTLTSSRVRGQEEINSRVVLEDFHSSLASGEVYRVSSLMESAQVLINRQKRQFLVL